MAPDPTWPPARRAALLRDDYTCARCGDSATQVHHRRLRGSGGSSDPDRHAIERLVSVCVECHTWVHGTHNRKPAEAAGLIVRRWAVAAEIPVHRFDGAVYLTPTGQVLRAMDAA